MTTSTHNMSSSMTKAQYKSFGFTSAQDSQQQQIIKPLSRLTSTAVGPQRARHLYWFLKVQRQTDATLAHLCSQPPLRSLTDKDIDCKSNRTNSGILFYVPFLSLSLSSSQRWFTLDTIEATLMEGKTHLDVPHERFWELLGEAVYAWAHVEIKNFKDSFIIASQQSTVVSNTEQIRPIQGELRSFLRFANREENSCTETLPYKGHEGGVQPFVIVRYIEPKGDGSRFLSLLELSFFGCQPPQRKALTVSLKQAIKYRGLNVSIRLYSCLLVPALGTMDLSSSANIDEFYATQRRIFSEHTGNAVSEQMTHSRQIPSQLKLLFVSSYEWQGEFFYSSSSLLSSPSSVLDQNINSRAVRVARAFIRLCGLEWTLVLTQESIDIDASNFSFLAQYARMLPILSLQRAVLTYSKPLTQEVSTSYVLGDKLCDQDRSRFEQRTMIINFNDKSIKWRIHYAVEKNVSGHDADECIKNLEIADKLIIEGILRDEKEKNLS